MKKIFTLIASLMMVLSMSAATKTIYCKMAQDWWKADGAAVGAHYWGTADGGTSWPGKRMTPVTGETDLWSVDIDTDKYQNIIFTRVNGSGTESDWGAKTADLIIPTDGKNMYTITSASPVWGDPGVKGEWSTYTPNAPKTYKDITFTITANAAPQIHYWDGGDKMEGSIWENLPTMTATGNANEYTYTVKDVDEAKGVKYLLKIGNIQTSDKTTSENVIADFKDLMPEVYVKGVTGWTGDGHKMTIADDYASASVIITLAANLTADLKLTIGGNWMGDSKNAITKENNSSVFDTNGGQNGSIKTDIAGDYVFTYTYADQTLTVTYPTEEIEVAVDCYVTGNTALTGEDWVLNSENLKMTKVEGTEKYTYTFTALPANTAFELKVVYAGTQKGFSSLSEAIDGVTANGDNICFTLEETGDVTVTYDAETEKIALTGNFAVPVTYDYYIAGTLAGGWSEKQQGMEKDGEFYKHTFSEKAAGTYEFKITDGQFNTEEDKTHEHTTLGAAYKEVSYNEGNIKIVTEEAKNITVIFDATKDKITFEGLTPVTTTLTYKVKVPAGTDKCYIAGPCNNWEFREMTREGATDVFTIEIVGAKETDEYKYACQADWAYAEVIEGGGNRTKWSALDEVTAWNAPAEPTEVKCYLMGNGDWVNGVEMTLNPDNDNEYMLLDHYISAPFKFKLGNDWSDQVENYDFPGIKWENDNIELPEGIYDFYFKKDTKKAYIAAVYLRDVTNTWGTICLPHASTSFSGAKFYEVSSLDPKKGLWLDEIEAGAQLVAGKPYVFEATASTIKVTYTDAAVAAPVPGAKGLTGTFTNIAADGDLVGNYIIAENKVWVAGATATLPANRAYIANTVPTTEQPQLPGRRRVCMGENAATGLDQIVAPEGQAVKAIVNGQLIIIRDGVKYNVQGQVIK